MLRSLVAQWFDRVVSWLRPTMGTPAEFFQVRFLVGTSVGGVLAGLVSAVVLAATGDSTRSLTSLALSILSALPGLLCRTRLAARNLLSLHLAVILVLLSLNALLSDRFEFISLSYLALIPMLALLGLGPSRAVVAFISTAIAASLVVFLHTRGLQFGVIVVDPTPSLVGEIASYLVFATIFTSLAFLFDALRERAVADAERAARARGLFLANISHELRTPMNGVIGMTDLLSRTALSLDQREQVDVIRRSGEALVILINDLLDYTKLETGKVKLERVAFVPSQLFTDTLSLFRPLAEKKRIMLVGQVDASVPGGLMGDPLRVKQILQNLVSNAVKFTAKGAVDVHVTYENGSLLLRVDDEGIGIGEETAKVLFRPFIQADESTTRRYGGTGLGLAICHQLATQMGGTIALESKKGHGTTFLVTLPLPAAPAPDEEETSGAHKRPELSSMLPRALVVEDNQINQLVLTSMLVREGFTCVVAEHGEVAIDALKAGDPFAIVFMDCQMPVMDGYEATRRIRALAPPLSSTPIVAITASAMSEDVERCHACGMDAVLTKPVTLAALRPVIARFLARAAEKVGT